MQKWNPVPSFDCGVSTIQINTKSEKLIQQALSTLFLEQYVDLSICG